VLAESGNTRLATAQDQGVDIVRIENWTPGIENWTPTLRSVGENRDVKTGTDLFSSRRSPRFSRLNPDTNTTLYLLDEFGTARQLVAVDRRSNHLIRFWAVFALNKTSVNFNTRRMVVCQRKKNVRLVQPMASLHF
jgi:hypothetical protein